MSDIPASTNDTSNSIESTSSLDGERSDKSAPINYSELVRFLVSPFLESPDSLRVSCETSQRSGRVLVRLAIEGEDKGKVFGRGGRNIQAVRTALQAISGAAHQKVHLEVFGSESTRRKSDRPSDGGKRRSSPSRPSRRNSRPRPNHS